MYIYLNILPVQLTAAPVDLPLEEDLITLKNKLAGTIETGITEGDERKVIEATLSSLVLFNRRRTGEVDNLKISDWQDRNKWRKGEEQDREKLTIAETALMDRLQVKRRCYLSFRFFKAILPASIGKLRKLLIFLLLI
jgi:hypothetical protein